MSRQYSHQGPIKKTRRAHRHNEFRPSPLDPTKPSGKTAAEWLARLRRGNWGLAEWAKKLTVAAGLTGALLAIPSGIVAVMKCIPYHDTKVSVGELTISSDPRLQQARLVLHLQAEERGNADTELQVTGAWLRANSSPSSSDIPLDGDISLREGKFRTKSPVIFRAGASKNVECWIVLKLDRAGQFLQKAGTRSLVVELKDNKNKTYTTSFCFNLEDNAIDLSQPADITYGNEYLLGCG